MKHGFVIIYIIKWGMRMINIQERVLIETKIYDKEGRQIEETTQEIIIRNRNTYI